jgi:hypothetical protein
MKARLVASPLQDARRWRAPQGEGLLLPRGASGGPYRARSRQFDRKTPAFPPAILIQLLHSGFADRSGHRQVGRAQLHAQRILSTDSMKE